MAVQVTGGAAAIGTSPAAGTIPANHAYYVKEFVDIANPKLVYDMFGTPANIPANSSNKISFQKIEKLSTAGNFAITEGVTPAAEQDFEINRIEQTVGQYGAYAKLSDRLHEESINGLTSQVNQRMAEQGGEVMNLVVRDNLLGGTNAYYNGGVANQNSIVTLGMTAAAFEYMYIALKNNLVKPIRVMTKGSTNVGTGPSRAIYAVVCSVDAIPFIEALDDGRGNKFRSVETYAGQVATYDNEHGMFKNFCFILDTESAVVTNGVTGRDINRALVFGRDAYHYSTINGKDMELIIKSIGSAGTADPMNLESSIAWKAKKAAVIVQELYMFRYEFALT
jgi:N4-gp56 family major capsid protein